MNLDHATFFIRITIVCSESASSASKLRSKQYPVKISSRKKQTIRSQTSGTAVDALNNGPSIHAYLSWTMKRAFQNYGNRRRSEERGVVTNRQWQTYQYVRGGRPGDASRRCKNWRIGGKHTFSGSRVSGELSDDARCCHLQSEEELRIKEGFVNPGQTRT